MDKGCLKCRMVHKESGSTMLQTPRIQCVQPRCYFEVGSTQAYLKLKVVDGAVIYMFEHRNNWDWELPIHFKRPPASIWECITDRRFPQDQNLLMIFHPWPRHTAYTCRLYGLSESYQQHFDGFRSNTWGACELQEHTVLHILYGAATRT